MEAETQSRLIQRWKTRSGWHCASTGMEDPLPRQQKTTEKRVRANTMRLLYGGLPRRLEYEDALSTRPSCLITVHQTSNADYKPLHSTSSPRTAQRLLVIGKAYRTYHQVEVRFEWSTGGSNLACSVADGAHDATVHMCVCRSNKVLVTK